MNILEDNHIDFNKIMKHHQIFSQFSSTRIMVIDDEEFCICSMKAILHKYNFDINYQVDYCMSGLEAITQIKSTYSCYSCL